MASAVPRLITREITKQWTRAATNNKLWSPQELLAGDASFFPATCRLTVKRSSSRFFMYEEHGQAKLQDDATTATEVLQRSPAELADLLCQDHRKDKDDQHSHYHNHYHYWTSPIADVAPGMLEHLLEGYKSLHSNDSQQFLDPRGPSLWMGSAGSSTQAHYDVADNVIVQLFGSKRIRLYQPSAACELHVFPDAHPRARKSQVNFDVPHHGRFPHFCSLPPPFFDVTLQPGDAMQIPAFWFHHVENGDMSHASNNIEKGPSVSLNLFALSAPMMVAQGIFRNASRPFGSTIIMPTNTDGTAQFGFAVQALRALGYKLLEGLAVEAQGHGSPAAFIRKHLLDTRYAPLRKLDETGLDLNHTSQTTKSLTASEQEQVGICIARILPQFESLRGEPQQDNGHVDGVMLLVACHLLELWAVELVGAPAVADAWEAVLLLD